MGKVTSCSHPITIREHQKLIAYQSIKHCYRLTGARTPRMMNHDVGLLILYTIEHHLQKVTKGSHVQTDNVGQY